MVKITCGPLKKNPDAQWAPQSMKSYIPGGGAQATEFSKISLSLLVVQSGWGATGLGYRFFFFFLIFIYLRIYLLFLAVLGLS